MSRLPEYYVASNLTKNLSTAGLTDIEKTCVKATFPDDAIPKEKHIITLLKLADFDTAFLGTLLRRFSTREYRTVLKTLMALHRLARDGPSNFLRSVESKKGIFESLVRYQSSASPVHARLIKLYSNYWIEKINSYTTTSKSAERDSPTDAKSWALKMNINEAIVMLPAVQKQLDKLLQVDPGVPFLDPNIRYCFSLLFRDAMRLYNLSSILVFKNLEKISEMTRPQAAIFLQSCYNTISLDERFQKWHSVLLKVKLTSEQLTPFNRIPEQALNLLEAHLNQLDIQAGNQAGDGLRMFGAAATISSTVGQTGATMAGGSTSGGNMNHGSSSPQFHNDTMVSPKNSTANNNNNFNTSNTNTQTYGGYSNQKPQSQPQQQTHQTNQTNNNDSFGFDDWNDSEWNFDSADTGNGANTANNGFGNANKDPFANPPAYNQNQQQQNQFNSPSVNNQPRQPQQNNNQFNSPSLNQNQQPHQQQQQQQSPQQVFTQGPYQGANMYPSAPAQNQANNQNSFHARNIHPAPQDPDPFAAFDAFSDSVPTSQSNQIKTTKTGTNNNPNNTNWGGNNVNNNNNNNNTNQTTQTENFINNLYGQRQIGSGDADNNRNLHNNGQSARSGGPIPHQPPPYDDDPFGVLVNNNTGYINTQQQMQMYHQNQNNQQNPYQQPNNVNFGQHQQQPQQQQHQQPQQNFNQLPQQQQQQFNHHNQQNFNNNNNHQQNNNWNNNQYPQQQQSNNWNNNQQQHNNNNNNQNF